MSPWEIWGNLSDDNKREFGYWLFYAIGMLIVFYGSNTGNFIAIAIGAAVILLGVLKRWRDIQEKYKHLK
jgi:hypothetical protein